MAHVAVRREFPTMTADPTPAADPRLAELTEAVHKTRKNPSTDPEGFAEELLALLPARTATTEAEALAALRVLRKAAFAAGKHIVVTTDYPQGVEAFNRLCEAIDVADAALAATGMSESKKHSDLGGDE
jgi:hypothetical protein